MAISLAIVEQLC